MEKKLIAEMAKLKGGRTRLKEVRQGYEKQLNIELEKVRDLELQIAESNSRSRSCEECIRLIDELTDLRRSDDADDGGG